DGDAAVHLSDPSHGRPSAPFPIRHTAGGVSVPPVTPLPLDTAPGRVNHAPWRDFLDAPARRGDDARGARADSVQMLGAAATEAPRSGTSCDPPAVSCLVVESTPCRPIRSPRPGSRSRPAPAYRLAWPSWWARPPGALPP